MADPAPVDEEAKAKLKAEREARKKAQAAEKAAKKAERGQRRQPQGAAAESDAPMVEYAGSTEPEQLFGDYVLIQSREPTGRKFMMIGELGAAHVGQTVWVRARVHNSRGKGNSCFLVLRGASRTVQATCFKSETMTKEFLKYISAIPTESVVDIQGEVAAAEVRGCTQGDVELICKRCYLVSKSLPNLPLLIDDAGRSEAEIERSEKETPEKPFVRVHQDTRLDFRVIDLRVPAQNAIMRLQSAVCRLWRQACYENNFVEIHTPKLIGGASEGGASVFQLKYFEQDACLAQSPQLYKQMAIMSDFHRVFEIGPVFRAEMSNTHRHLCEFTGLDMEMEIYEHYFEALDMLDRILSTVFAGLTNEHQAEIEVISQQYPVDPFKARPPGESNLKLTHPEAIAMLREAGEEMEDMDDFSTEQEKKLGRLVRAKYDTDFYSIHRFPDDCRPFYTMPCPDDPNYTNSYDIYMRGEEICSGAQRIHDVPVSDKTQHHSPDNSAHTQCSHSSAHIPPQRHPTNPCSPPPRRS